MTASKQVSTPSLSSPPSWWTTFFIPKFQFMVHDRWSNVLFLHWKVPSHLESILEQNTAPFHLDRFDGSAWIGLILLTEENVGPSIGRSQWTCVTHHGVNVRTYVKGLERDKNEDRQHENHLHQQHAEGTRGIHFSSLECDDEFTSFGANFFGMPYQVAKMSREYDIRTNTNESIDDHDGDTAKQSKQNEDDKPSVSQQSSSESAKSHHYRMRSDRLRLSNPSLARIFFHGLVHWWTPRNLHSTKTITADNMKQTSNHKREKEDVPPQTFTVDCSWSHSSTPQAKSDDRCFSDWACERYHVYTQKYMTNWRGTVDHEPWPMVPVQLENLSISGVEAYEPKAMRPILSYMAKNLPDHVGFSPGVRPVRFQMLQPVG